VGVVVDVCSSPPDPPRTAHYNLAKLRDVYLHTNTLAALANLAPHMSGGLTLSLTCWWSSHVKPGARALVHEQIPVKLHVGWAGWCCVAEPSTPCPPCHRTTGLSTHASQRLVSLLHLLARRYSRLAAGAEGGLAPQLSTLLSPAPTLDTPSLSVDNPLAPWVPATAGPATAASGSVPTEAVRAALQQQAQQQEQQQQKHDQVQLAAADQQRQASVQLSPWQLASQQAQQQTATEVAVRLEPAAVGAVTAVPAAPPGGASEAQELELQLYADFLRIVLEVPIPAASHHSWVCFTAVS
jgi:hypothetical protein